MAGQSDTRKARLEGLRRQIARAASFSTRTAPLGISEVDACLNGGLACALHEIAAADHRSTPAALGFLLALSATAHRAKGMLLWPIAKTMNAFGAPYAPGLRFFG